MQNLALLQRKFVEIFWRACRWMWAKPPKLLLLAQSRVDWEIPAGKLTDSPFVWSYSSAKLSGTHSGELSVLKSLEDSHILTYWI